MENTKKFNKDFYLKDTLTVAKSLVGQYLVRKVGKEKITVMITETEAYKGKEDKASHAYKQITERTKNLYKEGGIIYIFLIYGMYYCINVVTEGAYIPNCVLIRGAKLIEQKDLISNIRYGKNYDTLTTYQKSNILNGPGKLCKALNIDASLNGKPITEDEIYIKQNKSFDKSKIKVGKRINIDYAEEAKDFLWRFYIE